MVCSLYWFSLRVSCFLAPDYLWVCFGHCIWEIILWSNLRPWMIWIFTKENVCFLPSAVLITSSILPQPCSDIEAVLNYPGNPKLGRKSLRVLNYILEGKALSGSNLKAELLTWSEPRLCLLFRLLGKTNTTATQFCSYSSQSIKHLPGKSSIEAGPTSLGYFLPFPRLWPNNFSLFY